MNGLLLFSIFFAVAALYTLFGFFSQKVIENTNDYFLGGRSLGLISVTCTLVATQLGGGMLLGTSQQAYTVGLYGIVYTLSMAIGFLLLGSGIASRLRELNIETTAQLFETHYNSNTLKKIASLLSIITLCGLLIAQIIGSKALLSGLDITNEYLFLACWIFIIIHTMLGGLNAVVTADTFQVLFIIIIFGSIVIYSLWLDPLSWFNLQSLNNIQSHFTSLTLSDPSLIATLIMPALFSLIEQDLAQRFFAAQSRAIAASAALCASAILMLFACVPLYLGMKANLLGLVLPAGASPLIPVIEYLTAPFILALATCGILAAITSTADSLLCAISSNIAQDFNMTPTKMSHLTWSKIVTCFVGVCALGASYYVPQNIITIIVESYSISVCCLLIPSLAVYCKLKTSKNAAVGAMIGGALGFGILHMWLQLPMAELLALACSGIGFYINR